ncbi:ABC transporter ATP-binding protein [Actinokineospora cianjurensis]|uniref:ABC-2 type transport system ATP-binding protein n=1 Tax=Actinokineospora cianjurensis TaxID=585224 RepID=A0A421AXJ9_9PSEU|nr:ABC transporter ATP-binding protein [Actinokineospora cianjurensis]RLK54550.1 ABC-2 type transport system ATP-binding protein [Actinokineospora cianjurensis]
MRAVEVSDLVKLYKKNPKPAVDGLSFGVEAGEVFGLLGPNGAGKTTTVGVLTTRVLPTSGRASVHGVDVVRDARRARQLLAVVPQRNNLDRSLNIRQNLLFHAAYHGVPRAERNARADEILDRMGLADRAKDKIDIVSGGQAQRVMIARALMHQPKVMFLDEPSTGLDPQARLFVHDRVKDLRAEGVTVVLTTHDMDEAAKLCDRVGIVDHGKLLALDTPAALTRGLPGSTTVSVTVNLANTPAELVEKALAGIDGVERVERIGSGGPAVALPPGLPPAALAAIAAKAAAAPAVSSPTGQFRLYTGHEAAVVLPAVLRVLGDTACDVTDLSIGTPSLEDVFIHLTGRELR